MSTGTILLVFLIILLVVVTIVIITFGLHIRELFIQLANYPSYPERRKRGR